MRSCIKTIKRQDIWLWFGLVVFLRLSRLFNGVLRWHVWFTGSFPRLELLLCTIYLLRPAEEEHYNPLDPSNNKYSSAVLDNRPTDRPRSSSNLPLARAPRPTGGRTADEPAAIRRRSLTHSVHPIHNHRVVARPGEPRTRKKIAAGKEKRSSQLTRGKKEREREKKEFSEIPRMLQISG